jgi:predicted dehydrogenase
MGVLEALNVGIVGVAGRGASLCAAVEAHPRARIHAVCDVRREALVEAAQRLDASEMYVDYGEMLAHSDIDAVFIGTPMHLHASQSIAALERDLHVLCEVTAAVSVPECRALVAAASRSQAHYSMAENCNYTPSNVLVAELVRRGLFGEVYYAEGEYLHELKGLNEITPWRRRWQTGMDGITYGTHCLGPILQWMPGDRVVRVCCVGSGHHYLDPRGDAYENQDSCVMLAQTERGALIKVRVDMLSERPHPQTVYYSLQGSKGCYESARSPRERHKVWLADLCPDKNAWMDLEDVQDEYLPQTWCDLPEAAVHAGHGGSDFVEVWDFIQAIVDGRPCSLGIHEVMDMTLPGLISQASIADGESWLSVPDSRLW